MIAGLLVGLIVGTILGAALAFRAVGAALRGEEW